MDIGHNREGANNGHMGRKSKFLSVITSQILLKITSQKASFVTLRRAIRACLNIIYPFTHDGTNMGRRSMWTRN
jgi:hypothetical protein